MAQERKDRGFYKKYFREIDVVHGLQTKPEDRDWLLSTPEDDVKQSDIVLYLGCNVLRTTHLIRTVTDIFKLMGVSFAAVGGKTYCCGIQHYQRGDEDAARSVAAATAANFQKFKPERVVMWCPSCIYFYDDIMGMREKSFDFNHVAEYLVENIDKLDFKPQPETTVALHYHTGRPQSDAEAQSAQFLLSKLPGVTPIDVGTDVRFGRHCTPAVRESVGEDAWEA
ncbi:MAG: (Fe-S)-binding protein, partial [Chloroflexi bacterium]|nr:(Fe-S)-binding protein [Chloroflexota bacterium]